MKYGAILVAVAICLLVWAGSLLGVFETPDGWLYDRLVSIRPGDKVPQPQVLLVDTGHAPEVIPSDQWQRFLQAVDRLDPAVIAFTFVPGFGPEVTAPQRPYVIGIAPLSRQRGYQPPFNAVRTSWYSETHTALLPQPASRHGVYRYAQLKLGDLPAFSLQVAQQIQPQTVMAGRSRIRVNFNDGTDWLPKVAFDRVVNGGLIEELVRDRVVLVGPVSLLNRPGLQTPVIGRVDPMSLTEYQAYTIETILRANDIRQLPHAVVLLLLLLVGAVSLLAYQRMDMKTAGRLTLVVVLVYVLLAWLQLHWMMLWLPLLPLLLIQLLLFVVAIRYRQMAGEVALHHVLTDAGRWIRGHIIPEGFVESQQHWAQVMNLVDQSLDLQRLIFLERVSGDHRVREVSSLRCNIDDIDERRRDYERTPYSTAIELGGPLRLAKQYLEPWPQPEQQYLVPLIYANDIVGFWAFSVAPDKLQQLEKFETMVRSFAVQIAEILYHRSVWQADQLALGKPLTRYMMFRGGDDLNQRVIRTLNALERRWVLVEQVLDGLETCAVLYDPFGRVLNANAAMEALTVEHGIIMYDASALDFLVRLTRMPLDLARDALSTVLYQKKTVRFPLSLSEHNEHAYLLTVRAISRENENGGQAIGEVTPFDIRGVLFEIADISRFSAESGIKQQFVERMIMQMRNDMEAILTGVQLLERDNVSESQRRRVLDLMMSKSKGTHDMLSNADSLLHADYNELLQKSYPVDVLSVVQAVLDDRKPELGRKRIGLVTELPDLTHLARAHVSRLSELLTCMLDIQMHDVSAGANIHVSVGSQPDSLFIRISGDGFGMPDDDLQRYLHGEIDLASEEFRRLREGIGHVVEWGGHLHASSELGEGISFELTLATVI